MKPRGLSLSLLVLAALAATTPGALAVESPAWLAPLSAAERVPLPELDPALPSPSAFLGYPLGARFTHHDSIVDYLDVLAAASPRVESWTYGETYEGRPLRLVAVSSPENIARLEELRRRHLSLARPAGLSPAEQDALVFTQPVIVWLGYGIHGNEAASAEAAMGVAYALAAAQGEWSELLEEIVVLIDPLQNPDGRERYLSGFETRRGRVPNADPLAWEHGEPWPGGRTNHYLVDLNRDWAWLTQRETRHRVAALRLWEPQVLIDLHEMGSTATYFFPPPAQPWHPAIDRRVLQSFERFRRPIASAFDALGWLYFNAERYDFFYPAYGDTYPSLRGTVGMTFEMAGGGSAGQRIELPDGSILSLADRTARHLTSSMASVRAAAEQRVALLKSFAEARHAAAALLPQSVLWPADRAESRAMADLLAAHGVEVRRLTAATDAVVRPGAGGTEERKRFAAGTYVVSTAQPLTALVEALLKLSSPLPADLVARERARAETERPSLLYDVTAWALPLAYNVPTWQMQGEPAALAPLAPAAGSIVGQGEVGYLLAPQGLASFRAAAELLRREVRFRVALEGFACAGEPYPPGTLFIPRIANAGDLEAGLQEVASSMRVRLARVGSSSTETGISLGSSLMVPVRRPRVALVGGEGVDATEHGALWHLIDQDIGLAHTRIEAAEVVANLARFDVIILPGGDGYGKRFSAEGTKAVEEWVRAGGILVASGAAVDWVRDAKLFELAAWKPKEGVAVGSLAGREVAIPGAVLATRLAVEQPLAAGLADPPPALIEGARVLLPTGEPDQDILTVATQKMVLSGLVWPELEERLAGSLLVGQRKLGRGRVIVFAQDPAFRLFWRATMPLFLNAVMFAGSW